ncbi:NAD-P-binding protein [Mycena amicta]|nr:NAD-P-binding protein [Mycena amicta]
MGTIFSRIFPPSFSPTRDIPSLSDQIILVTGGNTGIGLETIRQLVRKDAAKVYLAARSPEKAAKAIESLEAAKDASKGQVVFLQLDLADLKSVRRASEEFLAKEERLDVLFNNGGVMLPAPEQLTAQGYDLQFGTNVIGHYFLTELLLPALLKSHLVTSRPARIVHTSSSIHAFAPTPGPGIDFPSLKGGPERDAWVATKGSFRGRWALYGESKLGNILISNHYADKYSKDVLVSCAVHPGAVKTELQRHIGGWQQVLVESLSHPTPMGALTQLWAGTVAHPAEIHGQYIVPWGKVGKPDKRAADTKLRADVMRFLEEQVKDF